MQPDSTHRFSDRVSYYLKSRPRYPQQVIEHCRIELDLKPTHLIADVGSGTGFLTELFLRNGNIVFAVEPNAPMRHAAEELLREFPSFISIDGTAEATNLPKSSVDFITVGQAFHWFKIPETRAEFSRILRPNGWVVLIWNDRKTEGTKFSAGYEQILKQYSIDYDKVRSSWMTGDNAPPLADFFGGKFDRVTFENAQELDFEGVLGRALSSSYVPKPDHPNHQPMLAALRKLFDENQSNGIIRIDYDTNVYSGHLTSAPKST